VQDGVTFGEGLAGARPRVGRQPDLVDRAQLRDRGEAGHRQACLNPAARGVADLDRDTRVGQLAQGLVGHRAHQNVDLHLVVGVDAEAPALHRIADRSRARAFGRHCGGAPWRVHEICQHRRQLAAGRDRVRVTH
jgi:hypothetical protein